MKLVGLVFLGLILGFAITYAGAYLIAWLVSFFINSNGTTIHESSGDGGPGLLIGFLVVFPIAFFIGGIVTGYFSYYDIEDKSSLLLMAPALYVNLVWVSIAVLQYLFEVFMDSNEKSNVNFVNDFLSPIGMGLLWYIASAGGVFLVYHIRELLVKWWYRD
jgi:hypothetical protein